MTTSAVAVILSVSLFTVLPERLIERALYTYFQFLWAAQSEFVDSDKLFLPSRLE